MISALGLIDCSDFVADTGSIFALWSVMAGISIPVNTVISLVFL